MRDPSTFVNQYPRESAAVPETPLGIGVLGDMDERWNQDSDSDVDMDGVSVGGHAARAGAVSDFSYSSSDTEVSDDTESWTREGSDTTLVSSSEDEGDRVSTGSDEFPTSKKGVKVHNLKRKSSWAPFQLKKQKVLSSRARRRNPKAEPKKEIDYKKRNGGPLAWKKILSGLSGAR
jgi:hypothetical protein